MRSGLYRFVKHSGRSQAHGHRVSVLKPALLGAFAPWKLANAPVRHLVFPEPGCETFPANHGVTGHNPYTCECPAMSQPATAVDGRLRVSHKEATSTLTAVKFQPCFWG